MTNRYSLTLGMTRRYSRSLGMTTATRTLEMTNRHPRILGMTRDSRRLGMTTLLVLAAAFAREMFAAISRQVLRVTYAAATTTSPARLLCRFTFLGGLRHITHRLVEILNLRFVE